MEREENFKNTITNGYNFSGANIILGAAVLDKKPLDKTQVKLPLSTINRHGLIAGATGTGKTKTLQYFAEQLSENGVGVLMMDVKGDVSGIAKPGSENPKIAERHRVIGKEWRAQNFPVELLTISDEKGARMRATVSEFGPVLFSKMLELNDNQAGVVSLIFKYCDDKQLPLLDIKDFRKVLQHLTTDGKDEIKDYGLISTASAGVIMRKLVELEEQGAEKFFGEVSFEVEDLIRKTPDGKGYINIIRLCDIQSKPKLFSTFMLCLLAEVYEKFPESGDKGLPKLVIFIDEAHLIFREASKALLEQIETIIKLIRSKGVGIYFCTQSPDDIPEQILGQLGLKIQHALRAFTAKDRKAINLVAQNYPITEFYKVDTLLTELGIGEALVTVLGENGAPTPLAHTLICAPSSRMDILTLAEQDEQIQRSQIAAKYNQAVDRVSAYEMLNNKIHQEAEPEVIEQPKQVEQPIQRTSAKQEKSVIEQISSNPFAKTLFREVTRGLLGVLIGKPSTRKRSIF